jgi:hypothetical protein
LGKSIEEIANYFGVTRPTILSRLKEFWDVNFYQALRLFKIYPNIDKMLGVDIISNIRECTITDIDTIYLQTLIYNGFNMTEIAFIYERGLKWMRKFMIDILDIDFTPNLYFQSAQNLFYWKPRIINAIMEDYKITDIIKKYHVTTHFRELGRIWTKEFNEFNQNNEKLYNFLKRFYIFYPFINNEVLIDLVNQNKNSKEIDEEYKTILGAFGYSDSDFHKFLKRCKFVYNKIDKETVCQLITESASARDIDITFLLKLLKITSNMDRIAKSLQMGVVQARLFLRKILGVNYTDAIREFVWKPELISFIKKYNSISDIAYNEDYNLSTLRHRFSLIWADELKKIRSLNKMYNYLRKKVIM